MEKPGSGRKKIKDGLYYETSLPTGHIAHGDERVPAFTTELVPVPEEFRGELEKILESYEKELAKIERDAYEKLAKIERDAYEKLAKIERDAALSRHLARVGLTGIFGESTSVAVASVHTMEVELGKEHPVIVINTATSYRSDVHITPHARIGFDTAA